METPAVAEVNVFDFDDTLVKTKSHIYLTTVQGESIVLTPTEYAVYDSQPGEELTMDYREIGLDFI
jgi:FMN phosphatase YigB (HAD superfamily)